MRMNRLHNQLLIDFRDVLAPRLDALLETAQLFAHDDRRASALLIAATRAATITLDWAEIGITVADHYIASDSVVGEMLAAAEAVSLAVWEADPAEPLRLLETASARLQDAARAYWRATGNCFVETTF